MPTLSVTIITHNEAHTITDCLESVSWADEIIVLDSGSTDATVELAREYTEQVFVTDWPGFGVQKNRALEKANSEWVLSLDADERVSPELAAEIPGALATAETAGYVLPFQSTYLGRPMRHGDWKGEKHLRLFRRSAGRFTDDQVHERLLVEGPIETLKGQVLHHSFADLDEVLDKVNRYSSEGARLRLARGQRSSIIKASLHAGWTFFKGYILRAGFLDGREGFLLALSNTLGCFYRYAKLTYMRKDGET